MSVSGSSETYYLEDGERVYPCRCGETHRGPYAIYDWGHHNCFHRDPLVRVDGDIPGYLMCPGCGEVFWVKDAEKETDS